MGPAGSPIATAPQGPFNKRWAISPDLITGRLTLMIRVAEASNSSRYEVARCC
jgi:hypothetical protein